MLHMQLRIHTGTPQTRRRTLSEHSDLLPFPQKLCLWRILHFSGMQIALRPGSRGSSVPSSEQPCDQIWEEKRQGSVQYPRRVARRNCLVSEGANRKSAQPRKEPIRRQRNWSKTRSRQVTSYQIWMPSAAGTALHEESLHREQTTAEYALDYS